MPFLPRPGTAYRPNQTPQIIVDCAPQRTCHGGAFGTTRLAHPEKSPPGRGLPPTIELRDSGGTLRTAGTPRVDCCCGPMRRLTCLPRCRPPIAGCTRAEWSLHCREHQVIQRRAVISWRVRVWVV